MTDEHVPTAPKRLAHTDGVLGQMFSDAESAYRKGLDESQAWQRVEDRFATAIERGRQRPRSRRWLRMNVAVAAAVLLTWFGWRMIRPTPAVVQNATLVHATGAASISLHLAPGTSKLPDGTEVELTNGAQGTFVSNAQQSLLEFDRGRIDIEVAHQSQRHPFAVRTQGFEFVVLGTHFDVTVQDSTVELHVVRGSVAVRQGQNTLKTVAAGDKWSNAVKSEIPAAASSSMGDISLPNVPANPGLPSEPSNCRDLLRGGNVRKAEQCYLAIAAGNGLSAEMGLYEVARLRRDVLSDLPAALAALDTYESRFASGSLAPEVKMARVSLFAKLGRVQEALESSNALLATANGRGRAADLRLLRGNLMRDKKHDCAAAQAEYQFVEADQGPRGDQAQFSRADCFERLGRRSEAIQLYRSYLRRPKPLQAKVAQQRLEALQR